MNLVLYRFSHKLGGDKEGGGGGGMGDPPFENFMSKHW